MSYNILDLVLESSMQFTQRKLATCEACHTNQAQLEIEGMMRVWDELPGYFELTSWEDLGRDD